MSYYYNYYIGCKKDGKIYPLGPYNAYHSLKPVISRPRSFASNLHDRFINIPTEAISDELRAEFEYEDYQGNKTIDVAYLPEDNLPCDDYIRREYVLIEDVRDYERHHNDGCFEGFFESLTPTTYSAKLQNEIVIGTQTNTADENYHSASEYMFYAYPDYQSEEYETYIIRLVLDMMKEYSSSNNLEYVILKVEG